MKIDEKELDQKISSGEIRPIKLPRLGSISEIIKYQFCSEILVYKKTNSLMQKDLVVLLGINKSEVSRLCSFDLEEFSQERIISFVEILMKNGVKIDLEKTWNQIKLQTKRLQKKLHAQNGQKVRDTFW